VNDNQSGSINITLASNDTQAPTILTAKANPYPVHNASTGPNIYMSVSDNVAVDYCWANVTMPNGTSSIVNNICTAQQPYTTVTQTGTYNVTFYANDTSGNLATTTGDFIVAEPLNVTVNVNINIHLDINAT